MSTRRWRKLVLGIAFIALVTLTVPGTAQASNSSTRRPAGTDCTAYAAWDHPRVKQAGSPNVYLLDPNYFLFLIPDETTYFNLFDSWSGIYTLPSCDIHYSSRLFYGGAYLAKTANSPDVYLVESGYFHRIVSEGVFNKYGFSWKKIRTVSSIGERWYDWT